MTFVSIIIPVYNEEKYIHSFLDSLLKQDYSQNKIEIFIVDGHSSDKTCEIIENYISRLNYFHLLKNSRKIVPISMNIGIQNSKGEYIIRMDAHAEYPSNYISSLIKFAKKYNTDNIGGICKTKVKSKSMIAWAIKTVLSHKIGVGNSLFRTGVTEPLVVDTVPFGCFKRDVFEKYGLFDERLVRNQDIELNKRITKGGGKILLAPKVSSIYYARENIIAFAKSNYGNGLWNIMTVYYTKTLKSLSIRHFVPLLFILSIAIPIMLSFFFFGFIWLSIISITIYSIMVIFLSLKTASYQPIKTLYLLYVFTVLHTSYGIGSLIGVFKIFSKKVFYKI